MKTQLFKTWATAGTMLCCLLMVVSLVSSFTTQRLSRNILEELGISQEEAEEDVKDSFIEGALLASSREIALEIPEGKRVQVVNELGVFVKRYVNSRQFINEYQQQRESNKPDDEFLANVDPSTLKNAEEKKIYEEEKKAFQEELKQWEKEYPANHLVFVRRRLEEFLALSADVDFSAELVRDPGSYKLIFTKPEHEAKSRSWKRAYRAGKQANAAARQFAQQWLKELPK